MSGTLHRISFAALGTSCAVGVSTSALELPLATRALGAARSTVDSLELSLSRFDEDSDVSRVNARAGEWVKVDEPVLDAFEAALDLRADTDGLCDLTVLPSLVAAGYDRSYDELQERPPLPPRPARAPVDVDRRSCRVRIPAWAAVDLGATAKGYIASLALTAIRRIWPLVPGALVDLGGDLALLGRPPDGRVWRVGVERPDGTGERLGVIRLVAGGVATSGPSRRRFGPGGSLHHLIDPSSGLPAVGGPLSVTVVAADPVAADGHATALALLAPRELARYVERRPGLGALVVWGDAPPVVFGPVDFEPDEVAA